MKSSKRRLKCALGLAGSAVFLLAARGYPAGNHPQRWDKKPKARSVSPTSASRLSLSKTQVEGLSSLPMAFEPDANDAGSRAQFVARGKGMVVLLAKGEIRVDAGKRHGSNARGAKRFFGIRMRNAAGAKRGAERADFAWRGDQKLRGVSNYLIGNDPKKWRTQVPHYARAEAAEALPGVDVEAYGNEEGLEYDLRIAPRVDAARLRLDISGADSMRLTSGGDLVLKAGENSFRMRKPKIYEEARSVGAVARKESGRRWVDGGYVIEPDGSVGFRIGRHDAAATLVVDPSLSVAYATFLGGTGGSAAESVAVGPNGNVYVAGTTPSPITFPETGGNQIGPGPVNGSTGTVPEFFIAEINPGGGPNSLVYLTFLGGSGFQAGGIIAVDSSGDVFLTGTTTSGDFPVTDGSQLTPGPNDVAVSEIAPGGSTLEFSTLFGGSESESQSSTGGIAVDAAGNIYIAGDTSSTDLPVTTGAYQTTFGGTVSDGFLAIFTPGAAPSLTYCTYLGTNSSAAVGVGGIAVDGASPADAFIAGFTTSVSGFPAKNGFQTVYGGGASNAFLMEITPAGQGGADLVYGTLLGGSGTDKALAVTVDGATPPNVYVTGTTRSPNFPVKGTNAAYQPSLSANVATNSSASNAFLSVITQTPATSMTKLVYSTYLGGTQSDAGQGVAVESPTAVYVTGTTTSWSFPWKDNLQPFNGAGDAFIVKMDPQVGGKASLIYATPLGGTSPPGTTANTVGNSIALGGTGLAYVAGQTTAADFPTAVSTSGTVNGFQAFCASCAATPASGDAFVVGIAENAAGAEPSVYFNAPNVIFPTALVGTVNSPQLVAVFNGGEAPLSITSFTIVGPNSVDFSLEDVPPGGCAAAGNPGSTPVCAFEVGFTPSVAGPEAAVVTFTDNAPGNPQALELTGTGEGLLTAPGNLNFGSVPEGTLSAGKSVTITNTTSNGIVDIIETAPGTAEFFFEGGESNCSTVLSAGSSCQLTYAFEPNGTGLFQDNVNISYQIEGLTGAVHVQPVSLQGIGTGAAPSAGVAPAALAFGNLPVGTTSGTQQVTLSNRGSAALKLTGITVTGTNAMDFPIVAAGTSCPTGVGTLGFGNPAPSCTVSIEFAPPAGDTAGAKSATLNFADNAPGSPQTVSLGGTATVPPPALQVSPASLAFGSQSEGTSSPAQIVTIMNPAGGISADISQISITGTNKSDFVLSDPCAPALGAGSTCTVSVSFHPAPSQPAGGRSATLNVPGGNPAAVPLSGTATVAGISISPSGTSINFGSAITGAGAAAGTPVTITVTNTGGQGSALSFSGVSVGGTNAADFVVGQDTCTAGSTAPSGTCTIQITFAPACVNSPAARSATLTLVDNAPGSPQAIALSGTAGGEICFDPPATSSMTQTVAQECTTIAQTAPVGCTAVFSLELISPSGAPGSIAIACTVSPADIPCISPATVAGSSPTQSCASAPATVALPANFVACLTTTPPSSTLNPGSLERRAPLAPGLPVAAAIVVIALIAAGLAANTSGRHRRLAMLAQGVALLLVLGMAACVGAGSGGGGGTPGTPEQSYTVVVTATAADGTTRTINLTLIVN